MVKDLNSLKIIGQAELQERPTDEVRVELDHHEESFDAWSNL